MEDLAAHLLSAHRVRFPSADGQDKSSNELAQKRSTPDPITGDSNLNEQLQAAHGRVLFAQPSDYKVRLDNGENRYRCPTCGEHFLEDIDFLKHAAARHGMVYTLEGASESCCSDVYDSLHQARNETWYAHRDQLQNRIIVISLGSFCGTKFSIQRMGLGDAHLPFDWIRSTCAGVRYFLSNDFRDFFEYTSEQEVANTGVHLYRSQHHCFFHDDISQDVVREKLQRRISRLLALREETIQGATKDLLFVRTCASTEDLLGVDDLYKTLLEEFGGARDGPQCRRVLLVVVIDGQNVFRGPILHERIPSIMFYMQPFDDTAMTPDGQAYCWAITSAANAALLVPEDADPAVGFGLQAGLTCPCPSVASAEELLKGGPAGKVEAWDAVRYVTYNDVKYECFDTAVSRNEHG